MTILSFSEFLGNYLIWIFAAVFILYIVGKPRAIINVLNKIWLIKLYHNIPIFGYIIGISFLNICYNGYFRSLKLESLTFMINEHRVTSEVIISEKKIIFMCERTIFLYGCYIVFIMVFMKFSDVYKNKYEIEDRIEAINNGTSIPIVPEVDPPKVVVEQGKQKQD